MVPLLLSEKPLQLVCLRQGADAAGWCASRALRAPVV